MLKIKNVEINNFDRIRIELTQPILNNERQTQNKRMKWYH